MPAPIRPAAILCIGRNYPDHATEMGGAVPELVVFMKNPACVVGHGDPIVIGPATQLHGPQVDYEGELGIVIGRDCRDVDPADALRPEAGVIRGFCAANDVSARWWQKKGSGGQFCRGKSFDTFCPVSEVAPLASVGDPACLSIETTLCGEVMQRGNVGTMSWSVPAIIAELSRDTTLLAGTLILTGTPAGVGSARTPPRFLGHGDIVTVEIGGVGLVSNPVVHSSSAR